MRGKDKNNILTTLLYDSKLSSTIPIYLLPPAVLLVTKIYYVKFECCEIVNRAYSTSRLNGENFMEAPKAPLYKLAKVVKS